MPPQDGEISLNSAHVEQALNRLINEVKNPRKILGAVGEEATNQVRQNFLDQGRPTKWEPLSDATLFKVAGKSGRGKRGVNKKGKERMDYKDQNKKLIGSGMNGGLMGSVTYEVTGNEVHVGTNKPYGRIHHLGGQAGRGKKVTIPARPWLVLPDEAALIASGEKKLSEIIKDTISP